MEKRHYEELAKWLERLGLLMFGSLVVQKLFAGSVLNDPAVIAGLSLSLCVYISAFVVLTKS